MMADWVHCNTCFHQPGDGRKFSLTNCGHIFCGECVIKSTKDKCVMCKNQCSTLTLSSKMKPDIEVYFTDPIELMKKQHKQLTQVMDFQKGHRQRLAHYNRDKLTKLSSALDKAQKSVELERDVIVLKEENGYLRKLISRYESVGSSQGPGRVQMQNGRHATSPNSQRLQGQSPGAAIHQSSSPYTQTRAHGSKSPYSQECGTTSSHHNSTPLVTSGRLSVRMPPSGGRIGMIPRTPSPQAPRVGSTASGGDASLPGGSACRGSPMNVSPSSHNRPITPGIPGMTLSGYKTPTSVSGPPIKMFTPISSPAPSMPGPTSSKDSRKQIRLSYTPPNSLANRLAGLPRSAPMSFYEK